MRATSEKPKEEKPIRKIPKLRSDIEQKNEEQGDAGEGVPVGI